MVDVAVKTLQGLQARPAEDDFDFEEKEEFKIQMAIFSDPLISHPNIVKVYGLVKGGKIITKLMNWLMCNYKIHYS